MMKVKLFRFSFFALLALSVLVYNAFAQQPPSELANPFEVAGKYISQNNYITPIFDLKFHEERYLASPAWQQSYLEMMILLYGYVGSYDEAYRLENILYENFPSTKRIREQYKGEITDIKKSPVADYRMIDAVEAIESIAADRQVIMINEEHRTPFHRATTLQLLSGLYAKGFRYFAAETLSEKDTELQARGFPTQASGFYTADPIYADVIRTALKIGYRVVPYESFDADCKPSADNPELCNDRRERGQAQNLYDRILKNDPQAKILVHVGRGHNSKSGDEKFSFMAKYFQEITKINPFTIDQLRFSERRDSALEQPLYRFLTKNHLLRKPSVYQNAGGNFYNQGLGYDMQIFHPRMLYEKGRAVFIKMNNLRQAEKIDLKKLKLKSKNQIFSETEPILIQAFYWRESADAVPIDQVIVRPNQTVPALFLPAGKFRIRALDKSGKILSSYER